MRRAILSAFTAAAVAGGVLVAAPAYATFHLIKITEVFAGTAADPDAQFVELQMYSGGQTQTAGQQVIVYDATGVQQNAFVFENNLQNGDAQSHLLVATPAAETDFGVHADLEMTAVLPAAGGKVCWGTPAFLVDCASWGNYTGQSTEQQPGSMTGTPFNAATGLVPGQSMERKISGGSDPNKLDAGDDTDDSATDFQLAAPSPEANGAGVSMHERSITLSLHGHLRAKGDVTVADDFADCAKRVPVRIERRSGGAWKKVAATKTGSDGSYSATLSDRAGKYRAKAPAVDAGDDRCASATSKTARR